MRVAVIEYKQTIYVREVFKRHNADGFKIDAFVRWNPDNACENDIPVIDIRNLKKDSFDLYFICVKENWYLSALITYLNDKEINNLYAVRLFTMDKELDFLDGATIFEGKSLVSYNPSFLDHVDSDKNRPFLVHLETHVCDHCNLNCKACNNFAPWVREPSFTDTAQFERDVDRLNELFSGIGRFFLLGGEPLLAPDLTCEMIGIYRKYFPNNELRLLTNGLLIPKMTDGFWECLRKSEVIVHISAYPPIFNTLKETELLLQNKNINYMIFKRVTKFVKRLTNAPYEDATENNELCGSGGCHYLRNGFISKCPDAILVENMNPLLKSKDIFSIYNVTNANDLIRRLNDSIDLCKYCVQKEREVIEWEPVEDHPLEKDWLVPNRIVRLNNEIADLKLDIKRLMLDESKSEEHIETLQYQNKRLMLEIDEKTKKEKEYQEAINKLESIVSDIEKENKHIVSSVSYQMGNAITYVPRKMRRIYRAVRKHGLVAVMKYNARKIGGGTSLDSK